MLDVLFNSCQCTISIVVCTGMFAEGKIVDNDLYVYATFNAEEMPFADEMYDLYDSALLGYYGHDVLSDEDTYKSRMYKHSLLEFLRSDFYKEVCDYTRENEISITHKEVTI